MPRITLLTDFGTADGYVAAMKGVIASIAPEAIIDDVAHDIPRGGIAAAAWTLARYCRVYPPGTVHVVVVDPGVGTARLPIAGRVDGRLFVAPDNGVLTPVLRGAGTETLVRIEDRAFMLPDISATFHGRDIFAPVAAHLARGLELERLGATLNAPILLDQPDPQRDGSGVRGSIVRVDRFGNLISDVPADWVTPGVWVRVGDRLIGTMRATYGDVPPGELVALVGSAGTLEVAVRDGSAADTLRLGVGADIRTEPPPA